MLDNVEDENTIRNRILLRETIVRRLANKYLELIAKLNSLTRSEIAQSVKDILNEIDNIEISILKAENLKNLKEVDMSCQKGLSLQLGKL
jgi:hypothetical protein